MCGENSNSIERELANVTNGPFDHIETEALHHREKLISGKSNQENEAPRLDRFLTLKRFSQVE